MSFNTIEFTISIYIQWDGCGDSTKYL